MNEQEKFFSSNHTRLLNTAWIADILTKLVLIVFIFLAGLQGFQTLRTINYNSNFILNFRSYIFSNPLDAFTLGVNISATLLRGAVYFLVLKGVSLGLNMVVETEINYREKKAGQDE